MKTEQEIKNRIKELENLDIITLPIGLQDCAIANLKWVLKESKFKRNISDLTEKELKELCDILCLNYKDDVTVFDYIPHFETLLKFSERLLEMLSKPTQLLSNPKQLEGENEMV